MLMQLVRRNQLISLLNNLRDQLLQPSPVGRLENFFRQLRISHVIFVRLLFSDIFLPIFDRKYLGPTAVLR